MLEDVSQQWSLKEGIQRDFLFLLQMIAHIKEKKKEKGDRKRKRKSKRWIKEKIRLSFVSSRHDVLKGEQRFFYLLLTFLRTCLDERSIFSFL